MSHFEGEVLLNEEELIKTLNTIKESIEDLKDTNKKKYYEFQSQYHKMIKHFWCYLVGDTDLFQKFIGEMEYTDELSIYYGECAEL